MEKPEKSLLRTNSSVRDIVFYQLKLDKEEKVAGFMDNDSEEHFGKLARKGGETLLPGVFPHKTKAVEDIGKHVDCHSKKGKSLDVKTDLSASDTELETILFYGRSSSSELKFYKKEDESCNKFGSSDNDVTLAGKREDELEPPNKKEEDVPVGELRKPEQLKLETYSMEKCESSEGGKSEEERETASEGNFQAEKVDEGAGSKGANHRR